MVGNVEGVGRVDAVMFSASLLLKLAIVMICVSPLALATNNKRIICWKGEI